MQKKNLGIQENIKGNDLNTCLCPLCRLQKNKLRKIDATLRFGNVLMKFTVAKFGTIYVLYSLYYKPLISTLNKLYLLFKVRRPGRSSSNLNFPIRNLERSGGSLMLISK